MPGPCCYISQVTEGLCERAQLLGPHEGSLGKTRNTFKTLNPIDHKTLLNHEPIDL